MKETGSSHCVVTRDGKSRQKRETWWWNPTVQETAATKRRILKNWQQTKTQEDHAEYNTAKKEAKKTVAMARATAVENLYERLETREGEKAILFSAVYRLARTRDHMTKDNYQG